jgi:hypothetical protein
MACDAEIGANLAAVLMAHNLKLRDTSILGYANKHEALTRGFDQDSSPGLNEEPGVREFTLQPETSVAKADAWSELAHPRHP